MTRRSCSVAVLGLLLALPIARSAAAQDASASAVSADAPAETPASEPPAPPVATPEGPVAPGSEGPAVPGEDAPVADTPIAGEQAAAPAPEAAAPAVAQGVPDGPIIEAGSLDTAVGELLAGAIEPVRIAVSTVKDDNPPRGEAVSKAIATALLRAGGIEVVTPASVRAVLGEYEDAALRGEDPGPLKSLAADHVVLGSVVDVGGKPVVELQLLHSESGAIVSRAKADVAGAGRQTTANASSVRGAVGHLVDEVTTAMMSVPGELRYQRLAVAPLDAKGAAVKNNRIDRFLRAELTSALTERGFLVVEREQLDEAMNQITQGALLDEQDAPEMGRLLDAQAIVVGSVAEAGDAFVVNIRVIGTTDGVVYGTGGATVPRKGVVTLASSSIETRSPGEALFRSLIVPGWGQFYNLEPVKGGVFAGFAYGGLAMTAGIGLAGFGTWAYYNNYIPAADADIKDTQAFTRNLRVAASGLLLTAAVGSVLTGAIWGANGLDAYLSGAE